MLPGTQAARQDSDIDTLHAIVHDEPAVFSDFFFSSRRRHTRCLSDWSSDVCSSDLWPLSVCSADVGGPGPDAGTDAAEAGAGADGTGGAADGGRGGASGEAGAGAAGGDGTNGGGCRCQTGEIGRASCRERAESRVGR